jgi:hypothetical protein
MDTFDAVVAELFGSALDPREMRDLVSKMDDASEMHVTAPLTGAAQKKHQRKKVLNIVGQGLNGLAIGAGGHALVMAGRDPRLAESTSRTGRIASAPYKQWKKTPMHRTLNRLGGEGKIAGKSTKYAVPFAVGALGLHTAELVGDSIAARALHDQRKEIKKAFEDIVDARRRGVITSDQAITMSSDLLELVSKNTPDHREIMSAVDAIAPIIPGKKAEMANTSLKATQRVATKGKKMLKAAKQPEAPPVTATGDEEPLAKSAGPEITWSGEIAKMDSSKRQVFGFAMVTHIDGEPVVDLQGDYTPLEEIEKAAYTYVIESRKGGDMHSRDGDKPLHTSDLVESFVITPEKLTQMGLEENALPHGWWVGFKVNDDKQWEDVVAKRRTGFSIHGSGRRVDKMMGV